MKKLLLCSSLIAFVATSSTVLASTSGYDSDTATIKKAGCDKMADVHVSGKSYPAGISFADGASWDSVKDHYELSPAAEDVVKSGKSAISIAADGTASFKQGAAVSCPVKKKK